MRCDVRSPEEALIASACQTTGHKGIHIANHPDAGRHREEEFLRAYEQSWSAPGTADTVMGGRFMRFALVLTEPGNPVHVIK